MIEALALFTGVYLAYANGANDNFKGVATLFGTKTARYGTSLALATVCQVLGSVAVLFLAHGLTAKFSGKGPVPDSVVTMKTFSLSVGLAAATTVSLASRLGFPVSTTHALVGALVGAGLSASPEGVKYSQLGTTFFLPLLLSPVIALTLTWVICRVFKGGEIAFEARAAATEEDESLVTGAAGAASGAFLHYLSCASICFARALNDTPKIAAALLIGGAFPSSMTITVVAGAMALGGLLGSRKVAETLSHRIATTMEGSHGLAANLVTGFLVLFASKLSLPVSTTHVSVGSLTAIGLSSGTAQARTLLSIFGAWVSTLPIAAVMGVLINYGLNRLI